MMEKYKIISSVEKFYTSYKAREIEKILTRTDWQDEVQEYIRAKAKVDVLEANDSSKNQSSRCVSFLVNHPCNRVVKFFLRNPHYKPAGLTTTVQLAYLCETDWIDHIYDVVDILEKARTTKVADRKMILNNAGYVDGTALFIEHLLKTELGLSLFATKSKYYSGYKIKNKDVYDASAIS